MDNVTHTLIGIAAAEALIGAKPARERHRVKLWVTSALANNLPDLDVALTWGGDRLDYLLNHRGHTHTLLLAPLQGLLLLAALFLAWKRKPDVPWREVAGLALLGPIFHICADAWNTYGVHPFWPLDNRWYYGDLVFIVEPWLWVAFLPVIWARCASRPAKALCLMLLATIVGLGWFHPFVQPLPALAITMAAALWLRWQSLFECQGRRIAGALALCASVFLLFGIAQLRLRSAFAGENGEVVVMSHPANPACAAVFTAGFEGEVYRARVWTAAALPELIPVSWCRRFTEAETSAGLRPFAAAADTRMLDPVGEFTGTREELAAVSASCRGRAFLRFARVPFWTHEGELDYVGDLRFDREKKPSFANVALQGECPRREPPWVGRFFPGH